MKAEITLNLRTREVYKLFERKISGNRLFIDAILHKMNIIIGQNRKQNLMALKMLHEIEQQLNSLTNAFASEIRRFEELLAKKKSLRTNKSILLRSFIQRLLYVTH